jgi:hypothetical protein
VIDSETGQVPEDLVLKRKGEGLEVEIVDEPVAQIDEFCSEGADSFYSLDGSATRLRLCRLRAAILLSHGSLLAASAPGLSVG